MKLRSRHNGAAFGFLAAGVALLWLANVFFGSVHIDASVVARVLTGREAGGAESYIVSASRVPMAFTALLAGGALAVSGLMLQTAFRNPLAGPSVLGINSGASLGVAVVMLAMGGSISVGSGEASGYVAVMAGAFFGSLLIMALLLFLSAMIRNTLMLLITGMMIGYLASSVIMLLNYSANAEGIQNYVMWGMGNFNGVSASRLPLFSAVCIIGIGLAMAMAKPLNLLMLGDRYALSLGMNIRRVRNALLLATGLLTAAVTAYCGPVSFLGLAVPHITRLIFPTDNHRVLLPATLLTGGAVGLACNLACVLPADTVLPLNSVTPLIGAPVVVWVLFKYRR